MFAEQNEQHVFSRLTEMFNQGRLTPSALSAWLDALEEQKHVPAQEPSDARLRDIQDRVLVDSMFEAGEKTLTKYREIFDATPHEQARLTNFEYVDYEETDEKLNACAFCAAEKSKCVDPAKHFGSRGESPPDIGCDSCGVNFWNNYNSEHKLAVHRLSPCKESKLALRKMTNAMPAPKKSKKN